MGSKPKGSVETLLVFLLFPGMNDFKFIMLGMLHVLCLPQSLTFIVLDFRLETEGGTARASHFMWMDHQREKGTARDDQIELSLAPWKELENS